jgi:tRNA threonylcarbamoyladenosine biosynthesis protein TsaB
VAGPPLKKDSDQLPAGVDVLDEKRWDPTAFAVARLGIQLFERGADVNPLELVPHYYRKSAAEERATKAKTANERK